MEEKDLSQAEETLTPEEAHRKAMQAHKGKRNAPKKTLSEAAAARVKEKRGAGINRRLTPVEWQTIKTIWATGNCTANDLAVRFGVSPETIYAKMNKLGIKKGSEATRYTSQVRKRLEERMNGPADELADRIRETKEHFYKWNKTVAMLAMKEIADAKNAGKPMSAITASMKTYEIGANILAKTRNEQYMLLGLDGDKDDSEALPELLISEMTAEEVAQVKNRLEENDEDDLMAAADSLLAYGEEALADDDLVVEGDDDLTDDD